MRRLSSVSPLAAVGLILTLMGMMLMGGQGVVAGAPGANAEPFKPKPLDVILVVDQSHSMFTISDPGVIAKNSDGTPKREGGSLVYQMIPVRQQAAQYFVDYLGVDQIPGVENRLGVIYFGQRVQQIAPLSRVMTNSDIEHLHDLLETAPPDLQWTDTDAAFEAAYQELFESPRANPDHKHVVVFLSDGHPQIAYPWPIENSTRDDGSQLEGKKSYYSRHKDIIERFREKGAKLYTVVIAKSGYVDLSDPDLQNPKMASLGLENFVNLWQQAASDTSGDYFRVSIDKNKELNRADLLGIYHDILAHLLSISPIQRNQGNVTSEDQTIPIPVGKCQHLLITVQKGSKDTKVSLLTPDNQTVSSTTDRSAYTIYKVENPAAGNWWLRFQGGQGTTYSVSLDCADITLQAGFLSPGSSFPQCKAMPITAKLAAENGDPVDDALVGVTVRLPDGGNRTVALDNLGNGMYRKVFTETQQQGQYRLVLEGHQGDRIVKREKGVSLLPAPYLDFVSPKPGSEVAGGDITVQVGVKSGCELAQGSEDVGGGGATVQAYLNKDDGTEIGPISLHDDGGNGDQQAGDAVFTGTFSQVPQGAYTLAFDLAVPAMNVQDHIEGQLSVGVPPTNTPAPTATLIPTVTPIPTPTPTSTPERAGHWLGENDITTRANTRGQIPLHFDSSTLKDGQVVQVQLTGVPAGLALQAHQVQIPPGKKDVIKVLSFTVAKELAPAKGKSKESYTGTLALTYPDGTVKYDQVQFTILPLPTPPWIYISALLGLLLVGGSAFGGYVFVKGRGQLTGKLVYESAPEVVDTMDVELYGSKYDLTLDEIPGYKETEGSPGEEEGKDEYDIGADYGSYTETEGEESLHAVLTFFARRGQQEAVLKVSESNKTVNLNDAPLAQGESRKLGDGNIIEVGSYRLRYEHLGATEEIDGWGEEPGAEWDTGEDEELWGNDWDTGESFDDSVDDDTSYDGGDYDEYEL